MPDSLDLYIVAQLMRALNIIIIKSFTGCLVVLRTMWQRWFMLATFCVRCALTIALKFMHNVRYLLTATVTAMNGNYEEEEKNERFRVKLN